MLREFWTEFSKAVDGTKDLRVSQVLDALNEILGPHVFPPNPDGVTDARACPVCDDGRISLKLGRFGAFVGCSNYPDCRYTRRIGVDGDGADKIAEEGPVELGSDPVTGLKVTLRKGPYGPYVQLGEPVEKMKPKRSSLPKETAADAVDLDLALRLLALPRMVGMHPETGKPISAGLGRYGPYVECEGKYARLSSDEEIFSVGLNRAVDLLASVPARRGRGAQALRVIGMHPDDGADIKLMDGRYGPYVTHGGVNATLPKGISAKQVNLEQAIDLLRDKAAKGKGKGKGRAKAGDKAKRAATAKTDTNAKTKAKTKTKTARTRKKTGRDTAD